MMNVKNITSVMAAGLLTMASGSAFAANFDAALATGAGAGASSTGNFDLSIYKGDAVSITGLTTVNINGNNLPTDQSAAINVCTYATTTNYLLEINSLGAGGGNAAGTALFDAEDATGALMPFTVDWNDGVSLLTFTDNGDPASVIPSPNQTDATCGAGTNSIITVTVAQADFNNAISGTYTDTLEVIITAQ